MSFPSASYDAQMDTKHTYRVAAVQTRPRFGEVEANLARAETMTAGLEADLIVFPELFATGLRLPGPGRARRPRRIVAGRPDRRVPHPPERPHGRHGDRGVRGT